MIRDATESDVPRIWELVLELAEYERLTHTVTGSDQQFSEALFGDAPICRCWVTEADGRIVGYALTFSTYSTFRTRRGVWLEDLYVTPSHRGCGLGKALLAHVISWAREQGAARIEWSVLDWNAPAIEFYRRMEAELLEDWRFCRISNV